MFPGYTDVVGSSTAKEYLVYNKCHISNVLDGTEVTTMWKIQILKFYSNSEKSDSECQ